MKNFCFIARKNWSLLFLHDECMVLAGSDDLRLHQWVCTRFYTANVVWTNAKADISFVVVIECLVLYIS